MNKTFNTIAFILLILVAAAALWSVNDNEPVLEPKHPTIAVKQPKNDMDKINAPTNSIVEIVEDPQSIVEPPEQVAQIQNQCDVWFNQAGISGQELVAAKILLKKENAGCDPQLYNMAGSDACGIAQELPCGKSGCGLPPNADGACQIRWQKEYVKNRYGNYEKALLFHRANNWY